MKSMHQSRSHEFGILRYDACLDVTGSDHKPVRCIFRVDIAHVNELRKRLQFGETLVSNQKVRSLLDQFRKVPEMAIGTSDIVLTNQDASILKLTNKDRKENGLRISPPSRGKNTLLKSVREVPSGFPTG